MGFLCIHGFKHSWLLKTQVRLPADSMYTEVYITQLNLEYERRLLNTRF